MPTSAEYLVIQGDERIVSIINDNGSGVAVPKFDDTLGGILPPYQPDKANRKIILELFLSLEQGAIRAEDQKISVRVKVPAGILRSHKQRFQFDFTKDADYNTSLFVFSPIIRIIPAEAGPPISAVGSSVYDAKVFGAIAVSAPNVPDEEDQSIIVRIVNQGGDAALAFYVEIDWSHSIIN